MSCAVFAEGEEEVAPIWQQGTVILIQVIGFVILVLCLYKFLFKPVSEEMENRQEEIAEAYKDAEEAKAKNEAAEAKYEQMLKEADEEVQVKIAQAVKNANAIKEEKIAEASAEIKRKEELAQNNILNEKEKALTELKTQTGALGVEIASKILREEIDVKKHNDLINNFIKELE